LNHRWSGWPGAWCLDCGIEDPVEIALADKTMEELRNVKVFPCREPGSNRCNPYVKKLIEWPVKNV
jgi:hypothetical protein